ncbi:mRNA cap guanine-N7 methyltransferase [Aspergillus nanangensis]|uniref:mRNA cap guanine-N7 methyltransferase n=1 Tax=Aspergillus nanangensis TaxID=2582783 RepID=A0AAD4CMY0_ASPNN|nr:mRNA cap guanine-N7 methyltransferase [Aspergillus nanangensis]
MPSSASQSRRPSARSQTPPLPPYEPPIAPLNAAGHAKLVTLLKSQSLRQLKTHLQHAEEKLTDSAGEINEHLTNAQVRYQKEKERKRNKAQPQEQDADAEIGEVEENDAGDPDEEHDRFIQLQEQVVTITSQLDEAIRRTIDSEVKVDELSAMVTTFETEAEQASSRASTGQRRRTLRARNRGGDEDEDEDGDEDENSETTPETEDIDPPSRKLDESIQTSNERWSRIYSTNNAYVGFYRMIHEAQHPGDDIPPLPHASTWFSHLEDQSSTSSSPSTSQPERPSGRTRQQQRNRSASPADSDDIAIERERISHKCPLTLLPFQDPVTSTKCPHSFERDAIESMIRQSPTTVAAPPGSRTKRVRSVKCPVCSEVLTAGDLRSDPVLMRRVRRAEATLRREAEEDELDTEGEQRRRRSRTQRSGITLASDGEEEGDDDDGMEVDSDEVAPAGRSPAPDPVRIKRERFMSTPGGGQ